MCSYRRCSHCTRSAAWNVHCNDHLFTFLWALFSAIGYARLMSGKDLIVRWHITAGDWDRFRAFDKIRAAEHPSLRNDMRIRQQTPPQGVDVIVGRGKIIVDDSYHSIAGRASGGRQINWLNAPVDPECIEFPKPYPRSKTESLGKPEARSGTSRFPGHLPTAGWM